MPKGASNFKRVAFAFVTSYLVLCIAAFSGCSKNNEVKQSAPPSVIVTDVVRRDVPLIQEWVGTMSGNIDADIRPKVDGFLLNQLYTEGSFVEKGQALFQLDRRQAQAAVEQAKGKLAEAKALVGQAQIDIDRYTPLVAERAVSQAELDKATSAEKAASAQQQAAQAALDNANLNLTWTTVVSPISGIGGMKKVSIGDLITPITVMTTVSAVDPIYIDFSITEQDYLRFVRQKNGRQAGQNLELILGDGTVFTHRGHALLINREVDTHTGTLQVRAEFPNPGNILRPGQYARIRAVTDLRKDALVVPQRAISELQGIYQVGVVGPDNKVAIKVVTLGPQFGDLWVIDSGVQAGDRVVVDGLQRLRDGITVAPTPFRDTQSDALKSGE